MTEIDSPDPELVASLGAALKASMEPKQRGRRPKYGRRKENAGLRLRAEVLERIRSQANGAEYVEGLVERDRQLEQAAPAIAQVRERNAARQAKIESQRAAYGHEPWWNEEAAAITASNDVDELLKLVTS